MTIVDLVNDLGIVICVFMLNIQAHAWRNRNTDAFWRGFTIGITAGVWRPKRGRRYDQE